MTRGAKAAAAAGVALALAAAGAGGYYAYRSQAKKLPAPTPLVKEETIPAPSPIVATYRLTGGGEAVKETPAQVGGGTMTSKYLVEASFSHTGPTPEGEYEGYVQVKETTSGSQQADTTYEGLFKATHRAEYKFTLRRVPKSEGGGFRSDNQAAPFTTYLGEGTASGRGVVTTQPEQTLNDTGVWFRINGDPGGPNDDVNPDVTKAAMEVENIGLFSAKLSRSIPPK